MSFVKLLQPSVHLSRELYGPEETNYNSSINHGIFWIIYTKEVFMQVVEKCQHLATDVQIMAVMAANDKCVIMLLPK